MTLLSALWLPIVLSAVIVFVASSIMHMMLPYHRSDYQKLPDEDKVLGALRGAGLTRGLYIFPFTTHRDMKSRAVIEKYKQGPVGMLTVFPSGPPVMPKFLGLWFGYCLLIGFFVAYLTAHTVAAGANYLVVFRVVGTAAFMAYGLGNISNSIWKGQTWSVTIKEGIDGLVYALLTAGTFGLAVAAVTLASLARFPRNPGRMRPGLRDHGAHRAFPSASSRMCRRTRRCMRWMIVSDHSFQ